jgi:bifunctional DNA-binding transcriptional regulator/antitoxin component of YhaV-PrlF toxin-antitoxin module
MIRSTLTERWQTTIPVEVRKALGLQPRQGLLYELRGESVVIRPEGETLMDLAGCLASDQETPDDGEQQRIAKRFVADNYKATER